jgi:hypothetical protein
MAELKTKRTEKSVDGFLKSLKDEQKRQDCLMLVKLMRQATGAEPKMWGESIVGFGDYHYKYESGREADWFMTGFSPRKQNLTVYLMCGTERHPGLLKKLGKYKTGKGCLYFKRLADIDAAVLCAMVKHCLGQLKKTSK